MLWARPTANFFCAASSCRSEKTRAEVVDSTRLRLVLTLRATTRTSLATPSSALRRLSSDAV